MLGVASLMLPLRFVLGAVSACLFAACSLAYPTNDLVSGPLADTVDGAADARSESGEAAAADAGADAMPTKCAPGTVVVAPVAVFDPIPGSGNIPACHVENALRTDGVGAGLDHEGEAFTTINGTEVTSCIAARFDTALASATVRIRAVANACGHGCDGDACGTGRSASTFAGVDFATALNLGDVTVTDTFAPYERTLMGNDRLVVICRTTNGPGRDDLEIDSFVGNCP